MNAPLARPTGTIEIERRSMAPARDAKTIDDEALARAVRDLNSICRAATLDFAMAVGRFVVTRFFGGDLGGWRDRDVRKQESLRRLARHPDLAMSPASLYRSVAMYELAQRIEIAKCRRISTSHLRLVLPLLPAQQERLIHAAEDGGWSVRTLEREIETLRRRDPEVGTKRGGRRRHSRLKETVRAVHQSATALDELLAGDEDAEVASPESTRLAMAALSAASQACARAERRLERHLSGARVSRPSALRHDDLVAQPTSRGGVEPRS